MFPFNFGAALGNFADEVGTKLNLPGIGLSEFLAGGSTKNTGRVNEAGLTRIVQQTPSVMGASTAANTGQVNGGVAVEDSYGGANSGYQASARAAADERAQYDDQIAALDRILGGIGTQTQAGIENLYRSRDNERTKLSNQKTQTLKGYEEQQLQNAQDKQRGVSQVDQYANQNNTSLQRMLSANNAGSSSVARELIPYLVSKSAGTRRANVFDTAGRNEQSIVGARKNAEDQYETAFGELDDQARQQEQSFRQNILNQENDLLARKQEAQMKREMANGAGYAQARSASQGTQDQINARQDQLTNLFSQFKPTFTQKALSFDKPELGQYTVDRAAVETQNQGMPAESSYYLSQLRRKQQEQF